MLRLMSAPVATVDIGTNTLLLLVVNREEDGALSIFEDQVRFGRLGKGLDASGNLADESIATSIDACEEYRGLLQKHGVTRVRAVGTQALREAANAAAFVNPAEKILGTKIETIPGEREAQLVYRAVVEQFPDLASGDVTIADVGGGSTEIIVARGGELDWFKSIKIGSVRMTERHLKSDPPTPEQTKAAAKDIDSQLAALKLPEGVPLIGTAGTATTVAAVDLRLSEFSRAKVHGHRMDPGQVDRLLANFLDLSIAERKRMPGMEAPRADVIAGGTLIFSRIMAAMKAPSFIVADCGVRWGLAYELLES